MVQIAFISTNGLLEMRRIWQEGFNYYHPPSLTSPPKYMQVISGITIFEWWFFWFWRTYAHHIHTHTHTHIHIHTHTHTHTQSDPRKWKALKGIPIFQTQHWGEQWQAPIIPEQWGGVSPLSLHLSCARSAQPLSQSYIQESQRHPSFLGCIPT